MHDHLKAAADAAAMSDDELLAAYQNIRDAAEMTSEEQAIIDEVQWRGIAIERTSQPRLPK